MMTRKEKLLIRPWQLRRYNHHKKKVVSAVSVIDFGPPPQRKHVTVKLKKLQKEKERQRKIEEDNFKLLQHLGSIMTKKRVDNHWESQPPNFLGRVGIYHRTRSPTPCEETTPVRTPETSTTRRSKCWACTPHGQDSVAIPEERIPWEMPKKILTRRQSGSATVPVTSDFDVPQLKKIDEKFKVSSKSNILNKQKEEKKKTSTSKKQVELPSLLLERNAGRIEKTEQKMVVQQGPLQIAINFPSFAEVKLVRGKSEKYINRNFCECTSFLKNK